MLGNVVTLVVLAGVVLLFAWLARRAWRSRNRAVRWVGAPLAALLAVLLGLIGVVGAYGLYRIATPRAVPSASFAAAGDSARGEHLAAVVCASCHSASGTLPLSGGNNLALDTGLPLGNIYPKNLTPGAEVANWSDGDIARAVRYAVAPNGRPLMMPVGGFRSLSDQDLGAIIAYVRTQPAVNAQTPENYASLLLGLLVGANIFNIDYAALPQPIVAPAKAANPAYGRLPRRRDGLPRLPRREPRRQSEPTQPPGPNLNSVRGWTAAEFMHAIRTGIRPSGQPLRPPMPWPTIGKWTIRN